MYAQKFKPGRYDVWVGDICLSFKTERDADRFASAGNRAFRRSDQPQSGEGGE